MLAHNMQIAEVVRFAKGSDKQYQQDLRVTGFHNHASCPAECTVKLAKPPYFAVLLSGHMYMKCTFSESLAV